MPTRERVAWCAGCEHYLPADEKGQVCPGDECGRRLRLRLGYICHECEEALVFFGLEAFRHHQAEYHEATEQEQV